MLENSIENNNEKLNITFKEYMDLQLERIKQAMQDPNFVEYVQKELNLDEKISPTRNQFVEIWNRDNSKNFREEMEAKYNIERS